MVPLKLSAVPVFTRTDASDAETELRPLNLNITEGEDAVFHCKADAIPAPDVQWYSNGDPIASKLPILLTMRRLTSCSAASNEKYRSMQRSLKSGQSLVVV